MPRAGLTEAVVLAEASRVADEVGFERLTLAAVAERFGVAVPSLYKHVSGMVAVRAGVAVRALNELAGVLGAAVTDRFRGDALWAMAAAYRDYARSHPGGYAATLRTPDAADPAYVAASEAVLSLVFAVLTDYGLTGEDAVDATRALRSGLHGFVALEAAGGFGIPQDVERSYRRLVAGLDAMLSGWLSRL